MIALRQYLGHTLVRKWDDTRIEEGLRWSGEIKSALASSRIAVLLVTQEFLASEVLAVKLLDLLKEEEKNGLTICWIPIRASLYERSRISQYQAVIDPSMPLDHLGPAKRDIALVSIAVKIRDIFQAGDKGERKRTALINVPSKEGHTFVCYAREDETFVLKLATDLKASGANIWLDQWNIPSGADWDYEIDKALYDCHRFLIILSPTAVESKEVRSELRTALDEGKHIVPVLYQACRIPRRLKLIQHVDFASGKSDGETNLKQLLRDLA